MITIDYCCMSYAYRQLATGATGTIGDLMKAFALYSAAAQVFFAN